MFLDLYTFVLNYWDFLKLPWVIKSGSHNGCHIIIKAEDIHISTLTQYHRTKLKFRTHDELRQSGAWR